MIFALGSLVVLFSICDGITTYVGMGRGYKESNPVMSVCMNRFGVAETIIVSRIYVAVIVVVSVLIDHSPLMYAVLGALAVAFCAASVDNYRHVAR